ncbi:exopolyphosphatase [Halomonas sediminis]
MPTSDFSPHAHQGYSQFRLVTRSDFDELVCNVLLKHLNLIDEITLAHPKDMQDGKVAIADAPSAARLVWQQYGGHDAFPARWDAMIEAVDKGDSAQFNRQEILAPQGWVLLNFIMDAGTGLERFREFRIPHYQLMMQLIDYCRDHSIEQILSLPDVRERVKLYRDHEDKAKEQIERCASVHDNLVVLDFREQDPIYATNRFVIYALYPQCNISINQTWGLRKHNTVLTIGKSILDCSSNTHVGELCLAYDGDGHLDAGTCQIDNHQADATLQDIILRINADG